jgi:hypothetical protein
MISGGGMAMLMLSAEYDSKKLLKAFKKVCVPEFEAGL